MLQSAGSSQTEAQDRFALLLSEVQCSYEDLKSAIDSAGRRLRARLNEIDEIDEVSS
jgi:hypothetical protein